MQKINRFNLHFVCNFCSICNARYQNTYSLYLNIIQEFPITWVIAESLLKIILKTADISSANSETKLLIS